MMRYLQIAFYISIHFPVCLAVAVCPTSDNESLLQPGRHYNYNFHGEATVHSPDGKEGRISLRCDIAISHVNGCNFGLSVQGCFSREGSQTEEQILDHVSRYPVLFSVANGEIVDVYANEEEPLHALNIKRGILSAFVFKLSHAKHASQAVLTDIHGICPFTMTRQDTGSVKTSRDLQKCNRTGTKDKQSIFFSDMITIDSTVDCEYDINMEDRLLNQVNCTEKHSSDTIQSNIYYRMAYKDSHPQKEKYDFSSVIRRVGIQFEQEQQSQPDSEDFVLVGLEKLSKLVEHSFDGIGLSTSSEFKDLIAWLRLPSDLTSLLKAVMEGNWLKDPVDCSTRKEMGMSYFADALIQCSNVPCIEALSHLVKSGKSPPNSMYYSWSNIHSPDPAILKHIQNICKDTNSRLCWLIFGRVVQKIYNNNLGESNEHLSEAVNYFKKAIEFQCASTKTDWEPLLRNLEVIENMGEAYTLLSSEGYKELIECFLKSYIPNDIKMSISEVLKAINPYQDETSYKVFTHILLNSTLPTNLRIIAYDQINRVPLNDEFGNIILTVLKTDENMQLKSHIGKRLKLLFSDTNLNGNEKRFATTMLQLLKNEELSLNRIIHESEATSTTESNFISGDLSDILKKLSYIGFEILNSKDQEPSSESFKSEDIFTQLIHKLTHIFGDQKFFKFETLTTLLQEIAKDIRTQLPSSEKLLKTVHEVLQIYKIHSRPSEKFNYSESILNNIKKLEEMYIKYKPESKNFLNRVSGFIGSIWHYFSSGEMFHFPSRMLEIGELLRDLEKGVYYNATRIFRILGAHQQVPTMMGLPLRWDMNAMLAFSLRTGLKLEMQSKNFDFFSKGFFQPRAALTYMKGMVIDLPTVTQVGVQANTSAFASTEWGAKLYYTEERKILSFDRPSISKNILQFFHTHQLLKHGEWHGEDLTNDASSTCTDNLLSSFLGLQFCALQSNPEFPTPNHWTWQFFLNPTDREIESYDLEFIRPQGMSSGEMTIKYSTSGSKNRREIFLTIDAGNSNAGLKLKVEIPALPHFKLCVEGLRGTKDYKKVLNLTLQEGCHYEVIYKVECYPDKDPSGSIKIPEDSKVQERLLSLRTPSSNYSVSLIDYGKKGLESTKIILSYNSFTSNGRWLYGILPQSLWESDTSAWLQFQIFWNIEVSKNRLQTICTIEDPQSTTQLSAGSLSVNGRERKYICASKRQISSGKLLAVAHFTYDFWNLQNGTFSEAQTQTFNLTIAQNSWAIGVLKERKGGKFSYEVSLSRTAVKEVEEIQDYISRWSGGFSNIHNTEQPQLKLTVNIEVQVLSSQELVGRYSTLKEQEFTGLWNQLITANLSFHYPSVSGPEVVEEKGYVIVSGGPTTTRFQSNLEIMSSYHNLQLKTHSLYRSEKDSISLYYNSNLTHVPTKKKTFHSVHFWLSTPEGKCMEAEFIHIILSRVFDLSTIVTYKCKPNRTDLHDLRLRLESNSSDWNMLNLSINQLVEDQTPEYTFETCNVTHPLLLINVTADWVGKRRDHGKRALFTCREENCQSIELLIQALHNGKMAADLIIPDGTKRKTLAFERTISLDAKAQDCKIMFSNNEESNPEGLNLKGEILNENYQVWNLKLHLDACAEIYSFLGKGCRNVLHRVIAIAKDAHHPVNKMFRPSIKTTLYEYFGDLHQQGNDALMEVWKNFKETGGSLKPFGEAPITLLFNLMTSLKTYFTTKDDSIITSITNYLNLSSYFYNMRETVYRFLKPREKILEWEFVTSRIIKLESFNQWPSIFFKEFHNGIPAAKKPIQIQQSSTELNKIAMIINSSHVFSFEEHLYPSIITSSDCVFLLLKNIPESNFVILSAKEMIHVLFPEMTISINKENEVFINESQDPSKLPIETSSGSIQVREDKTSVQVQSSSLTMNCRIQQATHLCVLQLDDRQSLETFGLLGSSDGSDGKEFSMPESQTAFKIFEFVSKYEVSGRADCKNFSQEFKFPSSKGPTEPCSRLLLEQCRLKWNIFQQFLEMCKVGFMEDAVSGYSVLCNYKNFHNSTKLKEKFQYSKRQKIEIAFTVQEHRSLKTEQNVLEDIEQLLTALKNQVEENGFSDVFFTLVSFGGQNSHQQSILQVKQKTWLILRDALKRLDFDGEEDPDISNVLKSASQMVGYNVSFSKIFILVTTKETLEKNKDSVNEMRQFLKKNGVHLYAFFPRLSESKDKDVFECTSPKSKESPRSECLEDYSPDPVSCMDGSAFCIFPEHSDSFFETLSVNMWSRNTRRSRCVKRAWWKKMDVCPRI